MLRLQIWTIVESFIVISVIVIKGICCKFDRVTTLQTGDFTQSSAHVDNLSLNQVTPCSEFVITSTVDYAHQLNFSIPNEKQISLDGHSYGVRPLHYNLDMNFLEEGYKNFQSRVAIELEVVQSTNRILLDINPNSLTFGDKRKIHLRHSTTGNVICIKSVIMITEDRSMVAQLSDNLTVGNRYTLNMGTFSGTPLKSKAGSWGLQLGGSRETSWALTTIFQMRGARTVFPCFDHPALKATFNVCVEHSADTTADSNSELSDSLQLDDGRLLECYQKTLKIPVYVLAFALMKNFTKINQTANANQEVDPYVYPRVDLYYPSKTGKQKFDWEFPVVRKVIRFLEEKTGFKYPLTKLGFINVNRAPFWGVENFGLVTLEAGFTQANEYERGRTIVVHEIIHQWLGDVVTCSDWSEICLQEGLTALLEWTISHKFNYAKPTATQSAREARYNAFAKSQASSIIRQFNVTKDIADHCFAKPPVILHMISYFFGDDVWYNVLKELIKNRPYGNANLTDWSTALDAVTRTSHAGEILRSWYTEIGYPVFYSYANRQNYLVVQQYIDLRDGSDPPKKPAPAKRVIVTPIRVLTEKGLAFPITKAVIVKEQDAAYNVSIKQWFIIDSSSVTLSRKIYAIDNYLSLIKCYVEKQSSHCLLEQLNDVFDDFCHALTNNWLPWIDDALSRSKFDPKSWIDMFAQLYNVSQTVSGGVNVKLDGLCRLCITEKENVGKDQEEKLNFYENPITTWNDNCRQLKILEFIGRNYTIPNGDEQ